VLVGHEARRVRPHEHSSEEVADDGGEPEPLSDVAGGKGGCQAASQRRDKVERTHSGIIALLKWKFVPAVMMVD
jgi:hypothetical protein